MTRILKQINALNSIQPARIVAVEGENKYTIHQICSLSDQISNLIKKEMPDEKYVPVYSESDFFYLVCMLGIWKAGKTYVPLQTDFPQKRLEYVLSTLGAKRGLVGEYDEIKGIQAQKISIQQLLQCNDLIETANPADADDPFSENECAYILMTSGSTGTPKFVGVSFANINWILQTMNELVPFGLEDCFIVSTPTAFDVSFHEILSWVYGDGKIVFIPGHNGIEKYKRAREIIASKMITHIAMSPSGFRSLAKILDGEIYECSLKHVILAGEELLPGIVLPYLNNTNIHFYNFYGPTETTIYATGYSISEISGNKVPIGKPLPGVEICLIDQEGNTSKQKGEICISGKGVSLGYINDAELTNEKFIQIEGKCFYKTGDYGFYTGDDLVFDCRKDNQIELNGARIELSEIDATISILTPRVSSKTVFINNCIITFVESAEKPELLKIKNGLRDYLPSNMLPNKIIQIEKLPTTTSGKISSRNLEKMYEETLRNEITPNTNQEIKDTYLSLYETIIEDEITYDCNLIEQHGLDSLKQIEIVVALEKYYGKTIDYNIVQACKTPRKIKQQLEKEQSASSKNLTLLFELIEDNIYRKLDMNMKQACSNQETYYLQKCYIEDGFSKVLYFKNKIPEWLPFQSINERLSEYIRNNVILSSYLSYAKKEFVFPKQPVLLLREYSGDAEDAISNVISALEGPYNELMFYCFVENGSLGCYLHCFVNHNICDQSSLNIIESELNDLFWRGTIKRKSLSYQDFIKFQNASIGNDATKQLQRIFDLGFGEVTESLLQTSEKSIGIKYPYKSEDVTQIIMKMNYVVMQSVMAANEWNAISAGTLFDIRKFGCDDYSDVIGDIHTTLPLLSFRNESLSDFIKRTEELYDLAVSGFNWCNALYSHYPEIKPEHKIFEHFIDDNQKISTNFIGYLKGDSLDSIIADIRQKNQILKTFSSTKLYITSFIFNNQIICIPLNDVELSIDVLKEQNCEVFVINEENK